MKESLLSLIWHHIFGYRYYLVTLVATTTSCVTLSAIFPSRKAAIRAVKALHSLIPVEVVSFRSRRQYTIKLDKEGMPFTTVEGIEYDLDGSVSL